MSGPRRGWIRFHVAIQVLTALIALAAANYLAFEYFFRADFSRSQKFVLSTQTRQILRELDYPLNITVFFSRTAVSPSTTLYQDVQSLLDEFVFSGRKRIRVKVIDPVRDLTAAREAQARYKFRADENLLILEYDGRTEMLPVSSMAEFDFSAVAVGGEPRLIAFFGEEALASAILSLISPTKHTVYFLQGHGEPPLGPSSPISSLTSTIGRQNVTSRPLSLENLDGIPQDASAIFIIGPQADLSEREVSQLNAFREQGGALCILLDPAASTPRLATMVAQSGIRPRGDRVLRTVPLGFATGILRDVTAEFAPNGPVTRRLAGLTLLLPGATQSLELSESMASEKGITLRPLLMPLEPFWGETEHETTPEKGVVYNDGVDAGYPLFVAASASSGGLNDERVAIERAKLIVVGNAQFVLDAALSPQGLDFIVSSTHWLLGRSQFSGTTPRTPRTVPLYLEDSRLALLSGIALIALPGLALIVGALVWIKRRN
ncbi:MAG: hypothetical protein Fur0032_10220 [Terrimicrobiaceae bacterium]